MAGRFASDDIQEKSSRLSAGMKGFLTFIGICVGWYFLLYETGRPGTVGWPMGLFPFYFLFFFAAAVGLAVFFGSRKAD
jgi:hypothetical protein